MTTSRTAPAAKPARTTRSKAAPKSSEKPTAAVVFSLDQALAELDDEVRPEPFVIDLAVAGEDPKIVTFRDVEELDWLASMALEEGGNQIAALQALMSDEDYRVFVETRMPLAALKKIMEAYNLHYGLPSAGEYEG